MELRIHWPEGSEPDLEPVRGEVAEAYRNLLAGEVPGADWLGWMDLPRRMLPEVHEEVRKVAQRIRDRAGHFAPVGIGGSYLGGRAVIEALEPYRELRGSEPRIHFAGHHLSGPYYDSLLRALPPGDIVLNPISKSGTTTETMLGFRLLLARLREELPDEELSERVVVTTGSRSGSLHTLAEQFGFPRFEIPRDVGGRFSVLSPVGLLPMRVAGVDTEALLQGAAECARRFRESPRGASEAIRYATVRNHLYRQGRRIELMGSFHPECASLGRWWQQLFGESEGKQGRGLFPARASYSTDLHSLGQYIQQGAPCLFETLLQVEDRTPSPSIPSVPEAGDGLGYLEGRSIEAVNREAFEATRRAHCEGDVPVVTLRIETLHARQLGELIYFFEFACALSALTLGVNPFNQPGVEAYKSIMDRRLGRPGSEERT